MIERPYFVYVAFQARSAANRSHVTGVSHYPLLDLKLLSTLGYSNLAVTAGPMPLARAMHEVEKLRRMTFRPASEQSLITRALRPVYQVLRRRRHGSHFDVATLHDSRNVILPAEEDLIAVADTLQGRILFDREIRQALKERGHHITGNLCDIVQTLVIKGVIGRVASVAVDRFGIASCTRCGNRDIIRATCSSCSSTECYYCPKCVSMGQARACRPLYYAPRDALHVLNSSSGFPGDYTTFSGDSATLFGKTTGSPDRSNFTVNLDFELTKAQKDASQFIVDFLETSSHNECLVFAVCGAGKTEVAFQAITHVLKHGGKVLFAIPRSDVVAEVVPRIASAIPVARILELRGNAKVRYQDADIVVATTHQTLRFFRAFDLVVLDEVDAFPYRGSAILHHSVRRATAPRGKTVFMTATPGRDMLRRVDQNQMAVVRISARHHGRPLPEPQIVRVRLPLPDKTGNGLRLPNKILAIIERSLKVGRKMFVFVPTVRLTDLIRIGISSSLCSSGQSPGQALAQRTEHSLGQLPRHSLGQPPGHSLRQSPRHSLRQSPRHSLRRSPGRSLDPSLSQSLGSPSGPSLGHFPDPSSGQSRDQPLDNSHRIASKNCPHVKDSHQPRTARIASIHAAHPSRELHRECFKTGNIDIIVSTSILERGITVANADVLVLYADYERIFDTATLIQMAGRAGRTKDDIDAKVYFVAERITASMHTAIRLIQNMNRHAAESGYLRPSNI